MRTVVALAVLIGLGLWSPPAPTLVIVDARVFTGDVARPWAQAIAIRGARITAVGTTDEIRRTRGPATRVIDGGGRLLVPGIDDAHVHVDGGPPATQLGGPPAIEHDPTLDEVLGRIHAAVAKAPAGGWIRGEIAAAVLDDPRATRETFDRITDGHPLLLESWTGHGLIANTSALRVLKMAVDEPDPPGGWFDREADGRTLTGVAHEYADFEVARRLAMLPGEPEQVEAFKRYASEAASYGITSAQSMMTSYPAAPTARLLAKADLPIRLRLIDFPMTAMSGWRPAAVRTARTGPLLTLSGTKWILDGTPVEHGMFLREPYADAPSTRGQLNFPETEISGFLRRARAAGVQPMFHAVGDGAIAAVLDALEATGGARWKPLRPRIEHGDMLRPEDFDRAKRMGVVIVQNPSHFMIAPIIQARLGPDRARRTFQVRSILAAGLPFALGSDGPMNPFLNIMFATIDATNPSQALSVQQALVAYTAGAAFAEFAEHDKGRLVPGLLADMALLSQDIFTIPPAGLPRTKSVLTIVDGRVVHDSLKR
ncbi:MAG TPA: amidohydrolase [Vicinamibacterales bacterium]|nr:amidohydrolase [Vicinamibacterales bacterium]